MKRLASLLAVLATFWPALSSAAIVVNNGGAPIAFVANNGANVTTLYMPTTADAASGTEVIGGIAFNISATALSISDTSAACSSYTANTKQDWNTTGEYYYSFQCLLAADLPPPCTITASFATNTLTVTAVSGTGFCTSAAVLASGLYVSGTSVTAQTVLSGSCTLTAGAGTCTTVGNAGTHAGETVTLSSTIKFTWTSSTVAVAEAIDVSGLGASPFDKVGTPVLSTSATSNSVTGVTLSVPNEILVAFNPMKGSYTAFAPNGSWTALTSVAANANLSMPWAYQIVSSTAGPAFNSTWTTAVPTGADFWTYEQASVGGVCTLALLGVGSC